MNNGNPFEETGAALSSAITALMNVLKRLGHKGKHDKGTSTTDPQAMAALAGNVQSSIDKLKSLKESGADATSPEAQAALADAKTQLESTKQAIKDMASSSSTSGDTVIEHAMAIANSTRTDQEMTKKIEDDRGILTVPDNIDPALKNVIMQADQSHSDPIATTDTAAGASTSDSVNTDNITALATDKAKSLLGDSPAPTAPLVDAAATSGATDNQAIVSPIVQYPDSQAPTDPNAVAPGDQSQFVPTPVMNDPELSPAGSGSQPQADGSTAGQALGQQDTFIGAPVGKQVFNTPAFDAPTTGPVIGTPPVTGTPIVGPASGPILPPATSDNTATTGLVSAADAAKAQELQVYFNGVKATQPTWSDAYALAAAKMNQAHDHGDAAAYAAAVAERDTITAAGNAYIMTTDQASISEAGGNVMVATFMNEIRKSYPSWTEDHIKAQAMVNAGKATGDAGLESQGMTALSVAGQTNGGYLPGQNPNPAASLPAAVVTSTPNNAQGGYDPVAENSGNPTSWGGSMPVTDGKDGAAGQSSASASMPVSADAAAGAVAGLSPSGSSSSSPQAVPYASANGATSGLSFGSGAPAAGGYDPIADGLSGGMATSNTSTLPSYLGTFSNINTHGPAASDTIGVSMAPNGSK